MKTITMDYELYQKELTEARAGGVDTGLHMAADYIKGQEWGFYSDRHIKRRCDLDKALKAKDEPCHSL